MEDSYFEANHRLWNEWTRLNLAEGSDYRALLERFRRGESTLPDGVREEVGDVAGKSLLHLMCHFGLDTLSWARQGAGVCGVDYAEEAIRFARGLSEECGLPAEFICSDVYRLNEVLDRQFDVVFTSDGVLPYLPDLEGWARVIAGHLKPGGIFYLYEVHPVKKLVRPRRVDAHGQPIAYSYFGQAEPVRVVEQGSYAAPTDPSQHTVYYWPHGLGEVVTALCGSGLRLEFLHEFPRVVDMGQVFVRKAEGSYEVQAVQNMLIPKTFSIRAIKDPSQGVQA